MDITFTKHFKDNLLHGTGIKVSLLGYIFCKDDLSKLDVETLNIADLKEVYDNNGKPFNFTYIPALEGKLTKNSNFEGVLGTYDIPLNKGLFKEFPDAEFNNVIVIGKCVEETDEYIIKKENNYIAAIIDLDNPFNEETNSKIFLHLTFVENDISSSAEMVYDNVIFEKFADVEEMLDLTTISATKQIILTPFNTMEDPEDSVVIPSNMTLFDTSEKINNNWNTSPKLIIGTNESNGITTPQISIVNSGENYTNSISFNYDPKNHYFGINQDTGNDNLQTELVSQNIFSTTNDNVNLNTTDVDANLTNTILIQSNGFTGLFNGTFLNSYSITENLNSREDSLLLNVNGYNNSNSTFSDVIIGSNSLNYYIDEDVNIPLYKITVIGDNNGGSIVYNKYKTKLYGDFWIPDTDQYECEEIISPDYQQFSNKTLIGFSGLTLNQINSVYYDNPYSVIFGNYNANDNTHNTDNNCQYRAIKGFKSIDISDRFFDGKIHFNHTQDHLYTNYQPGNTVIPCEVKYDEGDYGINKIFVVANGSSNHEYGILDTGYSPAEFASKNAEFEPNGIRLDLFSVEKNSYQLVHKFNEDFLFNGEAQYFPGIFAIRGTKPIKNKYYMYRTNGSHGTITSYGINQNKYLLQNAIYYTDGIYAPLERTSNDVYQIPFDKLYEFIKKDEITLNQETLSNLRTKNNELINVITSLNNDYPNCQFGVSFTDITSFDYVSIDTIALYFSEKLSTSLNIIYLYNDSNITKTFINENNESIEVLKNQTIKIFYTPSET